MPLKLASQNINLSPLHKNEIHIQTIVRYTQDRAPNDYNLYVSWKEKSCFAFVSFIPQCGISKLQMSISKTIFALRQKNAWLDFL